MANVSAEHQHGAPHSATRTHPVEIPEVSATLHRRLRLSDAPYELWVRGKLLDELGIRDDGRTRVEIIGGEIVVSLGPTFDHIGIIGDIQSLFYRAEIVDDAFPWRPVQNVDFNLERIAEGYIPDLVIMGAEVYRDARKAKADTDVGTYRGSPEWRFGETVSLPEPFTVDIPTDEWDAWDED